MFGSFAPPPRSGIEYWRYESLAANESLTGIKAGHPIGVPVHHNHRTCPCVDAFTGGELKCSFPHKDFPIGFHAYMPIVTRDGSRLVVGIRRNQFAEACEVPVGDPVIVSRGNHKTKPVIVFRKEWPGWQYQTAVDRSHPSDISDWLLRLWGIPELTDWVARNPEKAARGQIDTSSLVKERPKPTASEPLSKEEREAVRAYLDSQRKLGRWVGSSEVISHPPESDRDVAVPKVLDVSDLGVRNPLRNGHAK